MKLDPFEQQYTRFNELIYDVTYLLGGTCMALMLVPQYQLTSRILQPAQNPPVGSGFSGSNILRVLVVFLHYNSSNLIIFNVLTFKSFPGGQGM